MVGANYMGGRRNAIKARVKDTVGRQQKGHFGRQRLDILSKGIGATKSTDNQAFQGLSTTASLSHPVLKIDLAHARKKIPLNVNATTNNLRSFIPSPVRIVHSTPRSCRNQAGRSSEAHISSSAGSRSKLLDAVDLSEPLFLRRLMDQIIAMPNLAGIANRHLPKPSSPRVNYIELTETKISTSRKANKRKFPIEDENDDPRQKLFIDESDNSNNYSSKEHAQFCTPPSKRQKQTRSSSSLSNVHDDVESDSSSPVSHSRQISQEAEGYSRPETDDSRVVEESDSDNSDKMLESDIWSSFSYQDSSRTSIRSAIQNAKDFDSLQRLRSATEMNGDDGLPRVIVFDRKTYRTGTAYGRLFEQQDPWKTIGLIIGVTPVASLYPEQDPIDLESMLDFEEDDLSVQTDNKHEEVFENHDNLETDIDDQDYHDGDIEITSQPFIDRENAAMWCNSTPFYNIADPGAGEVDGTSQEEQIAIIRSFSCSGEHAGRGISAGEAMVAQPGDISSEECGLDAVREEGIMELDMSNDEKAKLLGTPELREVDGRFLGPSLFDDFGESDGDIDN